MPYFRFGLLNSSKSPLIYIKSLKHFFLSFALLILTGFTLVAQHAIEQSSSSYPGSVPNGPTISSQTVQFKENTAGTTFNNLDNPVSVTASFTYQKYTTVNGAPAGLCFGATFISNNINLQPEPVWNSMNYVGSTSNANHTSNPNGPSGTGIDVAQNSGFQLFATTNMWYGSSLPPGPFRDHYGDITFTFSRPVSDPVIHLVGPGASLFYSGPSSGTNNFSAEFELPSGSPLTLTKLSGTSELVISGNNKILNNSATPNSGCGSGAACGSVRINGTNISSVTFKVYMRFISDDFPPLSYSFATGDYFIISFSTASYNLSGNVFDDANGLTNNIVDGPGTNASGSLHALAVDAFGNVQGSTPVLPSGAFSFKDLFKGSYTTRLVTSPVALGSSSPAPALPSNWVHTGENLGAGLGSDGTIDGNLAVVLTNSDVANANHGIDRIPTATNITYSLVIRPIVNSSVALNGTVGSLPVGLTPTRPHGNDPEDGPLAEGKFLVINTLPIDGLLKYNNIAVTPGQSIPNFNPNLLTVQFTPGNYSSVGFTYSYKDAALVTSLPAIYILNFPAGIPLPVTFIQFTATKQNSDDVLLKWQTSSEQNNLGFKVQHSTDAGSWETLGFVSGAGNTNTVTDYDYLHLHVSKGTHYYRLVQMDMDGNARYSHTRLVNMDGEAEVQVYPNPAQNELHIIISGAPAQFKEVSLFDMTGRKVLHRQNVQNGSTLDISMLQTGTYLLKIQYGQEEPVYRKIIKRRM